MILRTHHTSDIALSKIGEESPDT